MAAGLHGPAGLTAAAGIVSRSAQDRRRQRPGHSLLANTVGAGEQQGMRQPSLLQHRAQPFFLGRMPDDGFPVRIHHI